MADKHDIIMKLRREINDFEEKLRQADMQTHFKDEIIKELRREGVKKVDGFLLHLFFVGERNIINSLVSHVNNNNLEGFFFNLLIFRFFREIIFFVFFEF